MNIYEKLKTQHKNFTNTTNQIIATEILNSARQGKFLKQKELSEKSFVSESTITKFSKSLGFSGYKELVFDLKKQNKLNEINEIGNMKNFLRDIDDWLISKKDTIKLIATSIAAEKNVYIYSSYQFRIASNFIYELLLEGEITPIIFETQYIFMKNIKKKKQSINIILFGGLDTESLVDQVEFEMLENFKKEKSFLITSQFSEEKLKKFNFNTICLDINHDSASFLIRNIAIQMLFIEVLNELKTF
ncbi:putative transcriptional regulator [Mesoplasma florum W37]|uniref:HTH rpiR-type domain-containing protein n=1 Tax=Mesoplasma florum TaxID=2151 RepID=A0AAD0HSH5_MESFO|nr:transcriptional regulator [Mesoplasma florum]AGY41728.1 putative transcriptional regulator [Mesoplasma florum W37]AVN59933.1 hypothetical protein CG008_03490 [Mesoplasma florum]AVN66067.1 hypothetical protein MflW12_6620 [Mesoplasma florum]